MDQQPPHEIQGPSIVPETLEPPPPLVPAWTPPPRTRLRRIDVAVLLLILAAAGTSLFVRLGEPGRLLPASDDQCVRFPPLGASCHEMIPLDEVHYVPDARDVVRYGTESDTRVSGDSGAFVVHPPVGKWFIAAGIKLFGDRPFGWRFGGAVVGTLAVAVMYFLALRLWRSPWWAAAAALLLAADGLWFVVARIAMLDIYSAFFVLLAAWMIVEDRDRPATDARRWWRFGAGIASGLAIATKWQVAPLLVTIAVLSYVWDVDRRRVRARRRIAGWTGAFVLVPLAVYVASYIPWLADAQRYNPPRCTDASLLATKWLCYQRETYDFHRNLAKYDDGEPAHPYFGHGYSWPWLGRPVAHFYETDADGTPQERRREVVGLPNPFVWWPGFFVAFPLLGWWAFRRGDRTARLLFVMFAAGFAPFALFDVVDRPVFLYYAVPLVPFVILSVVHALTRLHARWPGAGALAVGYVGVAVLAFAYFYPVLTAWPLSPGGFFGWQGRMWLNSDCTTEGVIKRFCWI